MTERLTPERKAEMREWALRHPKGDVLRIRVMELLAEFDAFRTDIKELALALTPFVFYPDASGNFTDAAHRRAAEVYAKYKDKP